MRPGDWLALRIEARAYAVVVVRPVHVVLDVFLPRPDDLDRAGDLLRDLHRAQRAVVLEAAAEATAQQMIVDADLIAAEPGELHDGRLGEAGHLHAGPDVARVLRQVHGAV